ncbi:cytidine deaminase [[Mycoplasma] testudinis]|uniref:cytidine deaminase n=1 Tax=[Mycoplasma] testudinis TaxID=33924 RepID=UPI00047F585F|nr:cytidine deaminase [[Mycoplasma] testudinis]
MNTNNQDRYYQKLKEIIKNAYTPYSKFRVACLLWTDKGWFSGVNVENASYPVTLCAERNAIGAMITNGGKEILKAWILTDSIKDNGTACGVCRQAISEFAKASTEVVTYSSEGKKSILKVSDLLPYGFDQAAMK